MVFSWLLGLNRDLRFLGGELGDCKVSSLFSCLKLSVQGFRPLSRAKSS